MAAETSRLNLAAKLAETAAELQTTVAHRRPRAKDATLVLALGLVDDAVQSLAAAVRHLADLTGGDDDT